MCLINNILISLTALLKPSKINVLSQICKSILAMSGKVTMLGMSRCMHKSYRTIQRFFKLKINWLQLNYHLFQCHIFQNNDVFLLAADETIEKKAGKHTTGIAHFFSNLHKAVVPGVAFMALSVVSVMRQKSYPLAIEQIIKPQKEKMKQPKKQSPKSQQDKTWQAKRSKGRPKGSKNKPKQAPKDIQYSILKGLLEKVTTMLTSMDQTLPCSYLLLDGYFGNQHYMRLAKACKLHLISKLKSTAALFLPYQKQGKLRGRPPKYGDKIKVKNIDNKYLVNTKIEDHFQYQFYQFQAWSKNYTDAMLNVVVMVCKNLNTQQATHCILFSTDLSLSWDKIQSYYSLRFQIEFNFRDAKQYFGLADFKNYKETQVTNAVNLSFFLCNFTYILIEHFKERFGLQIVSILDLKAFYRTEIIANQCLELKMKPQKAHQYLTMDEIFELAKNQTVNF